MGLSSSLYSGRNKKERAQIARWDEEKSWRPLIMIIVVDSTRGFKVQWTLNEWVRKGEREEGGLKLRVQDWVRVTEVSKRDGASERSFSFKVHKTRLLDQKSRKQSDPYRDFLYILFTGWFEFLLEIDKSFDHIFLMLWQGFDTINVTTSMNHSIVNTRVTICEGRKAVRMTHGMMVINNIMHPVVVHCIVEVTIHCHFAVHGHYACVHGPCSRGSVDMIMIVVQVGLLRVVGMGIVAAAVIDAQMTIDHVEWSRGRFFVLLDHVMMVHG